VHIADLENILFRTKTQNDARFKRSLIFYMLQHIRQVTARSGPCFCLRYVVTVVLVHDLFIRVT